MMAIQTLSVEEGARFRAIRLRAFSDAPSAFGTRFEDAAKWPLEAWSRQLTGVVAFVAVVGGSDVGVVRGVPDEEAEDSARLNSLWVAPEARGTGVGESLIGVVVEWARAKGRVQLQLDVSDSNESAIALYTRRGFVPSGKVGTLPPPREHLGKHQRILKL